MTELARWANFFVIVGSSAGALIGLQFVVMTLVATIPVRGGSGPASTYATPTIVHFSSVLLISATLSAPWRNIRGPVAFWGLLGLGGLIYTLTVSRRMRTHTIYQPVWEDWLFHAVLPFLAYATLVVSGYMAQRDVHDGMFGVAAAVLLQLFIGIHNAWDAVTYHVFVHRPKASEPDRS